MKFTVLPSPLVFAHFCASPETSRGYPEGSGSVLEGWQPPALPRQNPRGFWVSVAIGKRNESDMLNSKSSYIF